MPRPLNDLSTLEDECAEQGLDYEEVNLHRTRATLFSAIWDLWPVLIPFIMIMSAILYYEEMAP